MVSTPGFATLKKYHPHIQSPLVVGAPTRPYAFHKLAIAVTRASGLGFISATPADAEEFNAAAKDFAEHPHEGVASSSQENGDTAVLPIGIGYLCWMTDLETAVTNVGTYRVGSVWLYAWKDMGHLTQWVRTFRARCPWVVIYIQVLNVAEGLQALDDGCSGDAERVVLIAQGSDAGGHGAAQGNASIMTLLPELRLALQARSDGAYAAIPILAAGGIVDGTGAAAAMMLGASGVVLGTRLLASHEAGAPPGFKRHLLRAADGGVSTVRTRLFDDLRGTSAFPVNYDGRALRNRSTVQHEQGVGMEVLEKEYRTAQEKWERRSNGDESGNTDEEEQDRQDETWGENGRLTTYAGTCVGLIGEIRSARDIVVGVREGVMRRLEQLNKELTGS